MPPSSRGKKIRVLLVDDSRIATTALERILSQAPDIEIVGTARDGVEGLELISELDPTVICTDLYMPVMDGLEFTREVMRKFPRPILVVSVSVRDTSFQNVFDLLEAGAVDVFPKPRIGLDPKDRELARQLIEEIRVLSGVVVFPRRDIPSPKALRPGAMPDVGRSRPQAVAIGASTGGPQALQTILSRIPAAFPLPILCVQHIIEEFLSGMVEWLDKQCALRVKVADDGEKPIGGNVYFAPGNAHLEISAHGALTFNEDASLNHHRPSADVLLRSVAQHYGGSAVGVVLTGMGDDGASGLLAVSKAGGITIAQDEETSIVFGMPAKAIALGGAGHVLPIDKIADTILDTLSKK